MSRIGGGLPRSSRARSTRSSTSRYSTSASLTEASEGLGVHVHDPPRRGGYPVAVAAVDDVLPHGSARRLLHGYALGLSPLAKRGLLVLGETQCHGHPPTVSV